MAELATAAAMDTPEPAPAQAEDHAQAVVVARLPASQLRSREERAWLAGLLEGDDRGYALGAEIWFAVLKAPIRDKRDALQSSIEKRYANVRVAAAAAPQAFSLTAAALSGAVPFPQPLRRLITKLLEA